MHRAPRNHRVEIVALVTLVFAWPALAGAAAPTILAGPRPLTVGPGDRAGFAVTGGGTAPLAYQWLHDGVPIEAATADLLLISSTQLADAGAYSVRVTNADGAVTSASATLQVAEYTRDWVDHSYGQDGSSGLDVLYVYPDGATLQFPKSGSMYTRSLLRVSADGRTSELLPFELEWRPRFVTSLIKAVRLADGSFAAIAHTAYYGIGEQGEWDGPTRLTSQGAEDERFAPAPTGVARMAGNVLLASGDKMIVAVGRRLLRLNGDGTVDSTFSFADGATPDGAPDLTTAATLASGDILVGGGRYVWRVHADGAIDPAFALTVVEGTVHEIVPRADGGCWISSVAPTIDLPGELEFRLAVAIPNGGLDSQVQPFTFRYRAANAPSVSLQPDGRVIVSGDFEFRRTLDEPGREEVHAGVIRLMPDGSIDSTFAPTGADLTKRWWILPDGQHAMVGTTRMNLATRGVIEPPRILRAVPNHPEAVAGDDAKVNVIAVGPGPLALSGNEAAILLPNGQLMYRDIQEPITAVASGPGGCATAVAFPEIGASAPRLVAPLESIVARIGQQAVLNATVRGSYPMHYEWRRNGVVVQSAESFRGGGGEYSHSDPITSPGDGGSYVLRVWNTLGAVNSSADVTVGKTSELANLSVRASAGTGDDVLIVGFVAQYPKQILFQAIGPELTAYAVHGALDDPTAELVGPDGRRVFNDDAGDAFPWMDPIYTRTGAWPLATPTKSAELRPDPVRGINSILVRGKQADGIALAQIFSDDATTNRLVNLSARVRVGTGDAVAIAGFIIKGDAPERVLIRCVGPGLAWSGLGNLLPDPRLRIVNQSTHETVATNDDWENETDAAEISAATRACGAFALESGSKDAAILITLDPGAYTALATGANDTTGLALLEIYEVR